MKAGSLKHRLRIEASSTVQDNFGDLTTVWSEIGTCFAAVQPLSVKDYIHAQQLTTRISTRITIRYRTDVLRAGIRLVGPDGTVFTPVGILPDPNSGKEYLTLPCHTDVPC